MRTYLWNILWSEVWVPESTYRGFLSDWSCSISREERRTSIHPNNDMAHGGDDASCRDRSLASQVRNSRSTNHPAQPFPEGFVENERGRLSPCPFVFWVSYRISKSAPENFWEQVGADIPSQTTIRESPPTMGWQVFCLVPFNIVLTMTWSDSNLLVCVLYIPSWHSSLTSSLQLGHSNDLVSHKTTIIWWFALLMSVTTEPMWPSWT